VLTEDRVRLDGFCCRSDRPRLTPFDAAVITHGLGGNFYSSRLLTYFARVMSEIGISVVLANTRGHDNLTMTIKSGRVAMIGAAYEMVSDCEYDLNAWSNFLTKQGFQNQVFFGHSLGAIKTLYAQAHRPSENVKALVALSATRLCHQNLLESAGGDDFRTMLEQAQSFVDQGRGEELMRATFPFPIWMAAAAYLEKYGPADKYDWLSFVEKIEVPTLLLYGQIELDENPAFAGLEPELKSLIESHRQYSMKTIENADHFYSGRFQAAGEIVRSWLINPPIWPD